ncbi:MAG: heparan-alpha-glucosaminide N-acetyltransferase domain-containing protein, partial [Oscillospiraceae bacterium]
MGRSRTSRLCLLDELRGLLMALVVLYHLGYDLAVVFGWNMPWFWGWQMQSVRDVIAGSLMVLSGISSSLSHSNVRRGIRILL